jgi:hypothetical protein
VISSKRQAYLDFGLILTVCIAAMALLWCKLNSLIWLDPAWWLHESLRFARGEMPYRDFSWQYPPLALMVVGYPLRWFGISFSVAQITIDALSLVIVILVFCVLGYMVPRSFRIWICLLVVVVCATTQTYFSLFSFLSYSPALHVATIGLLLTLLGAFRYLEHKPGIATTSLLIAGSWISLLSKQEAMLAAPAVLGLLALFDPDADSLKIRIRRWAPLLARAWAPPAAYYLVLARVVGAANLSSALRGYGLASIPCPWWPTGLGAWGALAALGVAVSLLAVGSLFEGTRWRRMLGARYTILLLAAAAGAAAWASYIWYLDGHLLLQAAPITHRLAGFAKEVLSSSSILRPVLWAAIAYWCVLLWTGVFGSARLKPGQLQLLLLLTIPVSIGIRSLFGSTLSPIPEVPALDYPFLLLAGPYLLAHALEGAPREQSVGLGLTGQAIPIRFTVCLVAFYILLRTAGSYTELLSNHAFLPIQTRSGTIRVRDGRVDAEIYRYVEEHTQPGDPILELPYGGGMTFATQRSSPVFDTLFAQIPIADVYLQTDLNRIHATPPRVVIALNEPHFGTHWGIRGNMACVFPRLTWIPDRLSWDPNRILPLTSFIEEHYHVDKAVGDWLLLLRN